MPRSIAFLLPLVTFLAMACEGHAEHAKINLEVTVGRETATAHVDQTPPGFGQEPQADREGEGQ